WLDLTQTDIDHWEDPSYVSKVSSPYDAGCLASQTPDKVCGKLLTDPITREEIAGGNAQISGSFTQQSANDLATGINSGSLPVDRRALIFERFKEEVRAGRTITAAVDAAVRRAWPAIRDSNPSTFITCVILGFIGPSAVKGFAITLGIGVVASLISSIVVTHNLLAIVLTAGGFRRPALLGVDRVRAV